MIYTVDEALGIMARIAMYQEYKDIFYYDQLTETVVNKWDMYKRFHYMDDYDKAEYVGFEDYLAACMVENGGVLECFQ